MAADPSTTLLGPPVDWSKSAVGRSVWEAWNRLDSAIHRLICAHPRDFSACANEADEARQQMASALRNRDRQGQTL